MNFGNVVRIAALGAIVGGVGYALYKSIKAAKKEEDKALASLKVTGIILDLQMITLFIRLHGSGLLSNAQIDFLAKLTVQSSNGDLDKMSVEELENIQNQLKIIKLIIVPDKG
jgi:phage tail sheath gpL-like